MDQKRLTLSFPNRTVERLEDLKEITSASSTTDVVKSAVLTYTSIVNHLSQGVVFYAQKPNGERVEVEFMIDVPVTTPNLKLVK